ncbi:anthranilate synthase component 1 [Glaciihabitans tibetensis]|uniref:Anthranilate synthase component 1 n=1 Tax=Glaciihabitans tibetensis TaxID=1266600 RepID=A0A2T0VIZ7_9MICO|nr:anthranilate synthase component I family protein [Glaciihabitans tibetensis]PRY70188.1 anthranilate synthase component 1 [Glaciihabitans tibetensis]
MRHKNLRHTVPGWTDPAAAFVALCGNDTDVVWLDSGVDAARGKSYIGRATRSITTDALDGSILDYLRGELAAAQTEPDGEGFSLGWVGWLGYEMRFETMGLPRTRHSRYPDGAFLFIDRVVEFDHEASTVTLIALGDAWTDELAAWRTRVVERLTNAQPALPPARVRASGSDYWRYSDAQYLDLIAACTAAITEGEAYQLCLTTEFRLEGSPDPVATYLRLRTSSPTHHGALVRIGGVCLLSASPESFLTVSPDGVVQSRPIKGTRPRGDTGQRDVALRDELLGNEKERAENLMIVDLMRNDIGRISELGSVEVTRLLEVESYAQVHQLVSTVRGTLRAGLSAVDAVAACFPAGSMTGAPKRSATLILDALEDRPRGIYAGAFGYFGLDGRVDLAMVIRSIVIDEHGATVGSGGGITALSDPAEELAEVKLKAAALLAALGVR